MAIGKKPKDAIETTEPLKAAVGFVKASVTHEPPKTGTAKGITDGETHSVLLWGEGDTLTPCEVTGPRREQEIIVDNKPYSHVDTTHGGVWIYRNDRKN